MYSIISKIKLWILLQLRKKKYLAVGGSSSVACIYVFDYNDWATRTLPSGVSSPNLENAWIDFKTNVIKKTHTKHSKYEYWKNMKMFY